MKISSASKKVLASALSAAMVVAFAPTVAFGKAGTNWTVNFSTAGGTVATGHVASEASLTAQTAAEAASDTLTLKATGIDGVYQLNGYDFAGWGVDNNGNGTLDEGETTVIADTDLASGIDVKNVASAADDETGTLNLIATYAVPTTTAASLPLNTAAADYDKDAATAPSISVKNLKSGDKFTATLSGAAGVIDTATATGAGASAATFTFSVKGKDLAAGTYTFEVKDAKGNVVATKTKSIYTVTLDKGAGYGAFPSEAATSYLVSEDTVLYNSTPGSNSALTVLTTTGTYGFTGWYTSNGTQVTGSNGQVVSTYNTPVKGDLKLVAQYQNPQVSKVQLSGTSTKGSLVIGTSQVHTDSTNIDHYKVTIEGPNGFKKEITKTADGQNKLTSVSSEITVKFGQDYDGYQQTATKLEAGTYTVSVAIVWNEGYVPTSDSEKAPIASKSIELASLSYDLGEGYLNADAKQNAAAIAALPSIVEAGALGSTVASTINAAKPSTKAASENVFEAWTVNGKALTDKTAVSGAATVTASYKAGRIAAPTYTVAANGTDKFDLTFATAETGAKLYYNGHEIAAGEKVTVSATATTDIVVTAVKSGKATGTLTLIAAADKTDSGITAYGNFADGVLTTLTSASGVKVQTYSDVLGTIKADELKTLAAVGYATADEWGAKIKAAKRAVVEAAATVEKANLAAKAAMVKSDDGKTYSYVTAADIAAAEAAIDAVLTDFDGINGTSAASYKPVTAGLSTANNDGDDYATAIAKIVKDVKKTTLQATDVEPAQAVTAQLKAAKTGAEAQAALEAYSKLTATQKELVSAADLAAAQEIVAAAELKDAQDDAAVSKVRDASKTVKAGKNGKTTKKQSVTLKAITSKSGAKVAYKKSSGSSKITVKSGKAYLAKGVKKGTYKATVKATCGTQTAKIKVTFKVK